MSIFAQIKKTLSLYLNYQIELECLNFAKTAHFMPLRVAKIMTLSP